MKLTVAMSKAKTLIEDVDLRKLVSKPHFMVKLGQIW